MIFEEKTMKCERIYEGKILNLKIETVELPDKKYSKREIVEHANGVGIIPILDDKNMIMVTQYRKAVEKIMLEIPAGILDVNEEPRDAALRELKEETGYYANELKYMMEFYVSPGYSDEKIYLFLAKDLDKGEPMLDSEELLEHEIFSIEELVKMVNRGEIVDSKTIIAINLAQNFILSK